MASYAISNCVFTIKKKNIEAAASLKTRHVSYLKARFLLIMPNIALNIYECARWFQKMLYKDKSKRGEQ